MRRLAITLATAFAVLFGTGLFNFACLCNPDQRAAETEAVGVECHGEQGDIDNAGSSCCCCCDTTADDTAPADAGTPDQTLPKRCPCLYWTAVPFSTPEPSTGPLLVKRAMELGPVLLLEAAPAPVAREAAAITRARPLGQRERSTRLQAWLCVWTT